jgi:hypothetical protein
MFSRSQQDVLTDALEGDFRFDSVESPMVQSVGTPEPVEEKVKVHIQSQSFTPSTLNSVFNQLEINDHSQLPFKSGTDYPLQPRYGFPAPDDAEVVRAEREWKYQGDKFQLKAFKHWRDFLINVNGGMNRTTVGKPKQLQQLIRKYGIPACYRPKVNRTSLFL